MTLDAILKYAVHHDGMKRLVFQAQGRIPAFDEFVGRPLALRLEGGVSTRWLFGVRMDWFMAGAQEFRFSVCVPNCPPVPKGWLRWPVCVHLELQERDLFYVEPKGEFGEFLNRRSRARRGAVKKESV